MSRIPACEQVTGIMVSDCGGKVTRSAQCNILWFDLARLLSAEKDVGV